MRLATATCEYSMELSEPHLRGAKHTREPRGSRSIFWGIKIHLKKGKNIPPAWVVSTQTSSTVGRLLCKWPHTVLDSKENKGSPHRVVLRGENFWLRPNSVSSPRVTHHMQWKFIMMFPQQYFLPLKITAENSNHSMLPHIPELQLCFKQSLVLCMSGFCYFVCRRRVQLSQKPAFGWWHY